MELLADGLELHLQPVTTANHEGWANIHVEARVPGFTVQYTAELIIQSLEFFESSLCEMQKAVGHCSEAALESFDDPGLALELKMDLRGHIAGHYQFVSVRRDGVPTALSGSFDMDQSFLPSLRNGIAALLADMRQH
jgi:hypothetical protein